MGGGGREDVEVEGGGAEDYDAAPHSPTLHTVFKMRGVAAQDAADTLLRLADDDPLACLGGMAELLCRRHRNRFTSSEALVRALLARCEAERSAEALRTRREVASHTSKYRQGAYAPPPATPGTRARKDRLASGRGREELSTVTPSSPLLKYGTGTALLEAERFRGRQLADLPPLDPAKAPSQMEQQQQQSKEARRSRSTEPQRPPKTAGANWDSTPAHSWSSTPVWASTDALYATKGSRSGSAEPEMQPSSSSRSRPPRIVSGRIFTASASSPTPGLGDTGSRSSPTPARAIDTAQSLRARLSTPQRAERVSKWWEERQQRDTERERVRKERVRKDQKFLRLLSARQEKRKLDEEQEGATRKIQAAYRKRVQRKQERELKRLEKEKSEAEAALAAKQLEMEHNRLTGGR